MSETRAETRVFLKSETKTDRKPAVKITLQYKRWSAFCEKGKIARKTLQQLNRDLSICYLLKESASMLEQTRPSYGGFEIRAFCDKMRSFCTISASTFWKIQPQDGDETLIFKAFRLFWSRFDSSNCESPSKCFLLSNFDIPTC